MGSAIWKSSMEGPQNIKKNSYNPAIPLQDTMKSFS